MTAQTKTEKLLTAKRLYLLAPDGLTDIELAEAIDCDRMSAYRYRKELDTVEVTEGKYTLEPTQEDIDLALAILQRANQVLKTNLKDDQSSSSDRK